MDPNTRSIRVVRTNNIYAIPEAASAGRIRPWRIALVLKRLQLKFIIDLIAPCAIGRFDVESKVYPEIDLGPFLAEEYGVSRRHLIIQLENDSVVVIDNDSSNGTTLNGELLQAGRAYPVRHADELVLGAMELQVELLTNPLD